MPEIPTHRPNVVAKATRTNMYSQGEINSIARNRVTGMGAAAGKLLSTVFQKPEVDEQMNNARNATEYANADTALLAARYKHLEDYESAPYDPQNPDKAFQAYYKGMEESYNDISKTFTDSETLNKFNAKTGKQRLTWSHDIRTKARNKEIDYFESSYFANMTTAAKDGNTPLVNQLTDDAVKNGICDPVKAEKGRENALADANKVQEQRHIDFTWSKVLEMEDREDAETFINENPNLSTENKKSLLTSYDRNQRAEKTQAKVEQDAAIQSDQEDFVSRVYSTDKPLTHEDIDNSSLKPTGQGSKQAFHKLIDKQQKEILSGKSTGLNEDNSDMLLRMYEINSDPNQKNLTADEILDRVGKGISIKTAEKMIKTMDVTNSKVYKFADNSFKSQFGYEGIVKGFGDKQIGALLYADAMTEIHEVLAEEPLKGQALKAKMAEVVAPYLEQYWETTHMSQSDQRERLKLLGGHPSSASNILNTRKKTPDETPEAVKQTKENGGIIKRREGESITDFGKRTGKEY